MRKLAAVFIILLVFEITSCRCKGDLVELKYTFSAVTLKNLDNSGTAPIETSGIEVSKNTYGVRIDMDRQLVEPAPTKYCWSTEQSLLFQTANAFTRECPKYVFIPESKIAEIKITTLNDFDSTHPAGSEITGYFKAFENLTYADIPDFIETINYREISYGGMKPTSFLFEVLLMTAPTVGTAHSFKVQIILSDGNITEGTTSIDLV